MSLREFLREFSFPFRSSSTLVALGTFMLLITLASAAGLFGLWLAVAVVPAFLRYLTMIAEARARGREAATPGIEYFTLAGNVWTLFPVIPVVAMAFLVRETGERFGDLPAMILSLGLVGLLPAIIGVLVITHSPLQSIDPRAMGRLIYRCGTDYWYAPATAVLIVLIPTMLGVLPTWLQNMVEVCLLASFFAVTGAIIGRANLLDEIDIPDATGPDAEKVASGLQSDRVKVLNHGYGFVSRGNRDGGLEHIYDWLVKDPDPEEAWPWFLEQMLRWEDNFAGLLLAQQYLGRLLEHNDKVAAVKLMMRCRLVNETFRPLKADLPRAIAAAEACRNDELANVLSR
ncbi:MAG: hypothetical protein KAJ57_08835 [Woeseiaceae bacterium]|nr:hypothetical protein [Woeseiaceae bacterium]